MYTFRMNLENTLQKYIFPELDNDVERTERLITIVESLEPKQRLAFTAVIRKQKSFNENMNQFVKLCEDHVRIILKKIPQYLIFMQLFSD